MKGFVGIISPDGFIDDVILLVFVTEYVFFFFLSRVYFVSCETDHRGSPRRRTRLRGEVDELGGAHRGG